MKIPSLIRFLCFLTLFFSLSSVSAAVTIKEGQKKLEKVSGRLRNSVFLTADVTKIVENSSMGTSKSYEGEVLIANGRFAFRAESPEKSLILFDGSSLWNVIFQDEVNFKKVNELAPKKADVLQISRAKISKQSKSQTFLSDLLVGKAALKKIKIEDVTENEGKLLLKAKSEFSDIEIKNLILVLNAKTNEFEEIQFEDDLGNKTSYKFKNFNPKGREDIKIKFTPPKGVEVINL